MQSHPIPKDAAAFEVLCCEALKRELNRPSLHRYGKSGELQFGVDIVDDTIPGAVIAIQCKLREPTKALTIAEVQAELAKTESFPIPIARYIVCTTAKKGRGLQDAVALLNQQRVAQKEFSVEIMFWDEFELLLDRYDDLREKHTPTNLHSVREVVTDVLRAHAPGLRPHGTTAPSDEVELTQQDLDLGRARQLTEAGRFDLAKAVLDEIRETKLDRLTPLQRYRLFAYLSHVHYQRCDSPQAGGLLLQAVDAYPEHPRATHDRAMGYALLGKMEAAWTSVQPALTANATPDVAALYVVTAPVSVTTESLLGAIDELALHADVLLARGERALAFCQFAELSEVVSLLRPSDANPHSLFLQAALQAVPNLPTDPREECAGEAADALRAALPILDRTIQVARDQHMSALIHRAFLTKLEILSRLNDTVELDETIEAAARLEGLAPRARADINFSRAQMMMDRREYGRALRLLDELPANELGVGANFVRAVALWGRNGAGDRENARREARRQATKAVGILLEQIVTFVVRAEVERKAYDEALKLLESVSLEPAHRYALRAHIKRSQGDSEAARKAALEGFSSLSNESSPTGRRSLAVELRQADLVAETLTTVEPLISSTRLSRDTYDYLALSYTKRHDQRFLIHAEPLFRSRQLDEELSFRYLNRLREYDSEKALVLVQLVREASSGLQRKLFAVHEQLIRKERSGSAALAIDSLDQLPSSDEVPLLYVGSVVELLLHSPHSKTAPEYAYQCLLRFPDEPTTHASLIKAFLMGPARTEVDTPSEVSIGTWVEYEERGDNRPHDLFVTGNSALETRLLGKKVGDTITLAEGTLGPRVATIKAIEHSRVQQFRCSMRDWQIRFPDVPMIEQVQLDTDPETKEPDIAPLIAMFQRLAEHAKRGNEFYKSGSMPIGLMGQHINQSIFHTMGHLVSTEDLYLNCTIASDTAITEVKKRLDSATSVIIDETALWTLAQLGVGDVLSRFPIQLGTVQQVVANLRAASEQAVGAYISLSADGKTQYAPADAPDAQRIHEQWSQQLSELLRLGTKSSSALAALEAATRDTTISALGEATAHALAAAAGENALIWTDDRVVEVFGKQVFGVQRVWTQGVLAWLSGRDLLSPEQYREASARLLAMRVAGTLVDGATLVKAAELSSWNLKAPIFRRPLELIGDAHTRLGASLQMSALLLEACAKQVALSNSQANIAVALVTQLLRRDPTTRLVRTLRSYLPGLMRLQPFALRTMLHAIDTATAVLR